MCISVPARVISIDGRQAEVAVWDEHRVVFLAVENLQIGDWVLLYGGVALTVLEPDVAAETVELLSRMTDSKAL